MMDDNCTELPASNAQAAQLSSMLEQGVTNGMKPKLPALKHRYTREQLEETIDKHYGIVTAICNDIDCSYAQFYSAIKHYGLSDKLQEAKQRIVQIAESVVLDAMSSADEKIRLEAAKYTLSRLGKNQGWSDNPNIAVAVQVSPGEKETQIKAIFGIRDPEQEQKDE